MKDLQILEDHVANLGRAIDFIEQNIDRPFSLKELARKARMSQWHFQRVFHALIGEPVKSYVRRRRLSNVAKLLIDSSASLAGLAGMAGFKSTEAFSRAFKLQFGVNPGAFRDAGEPPLVPVARARIDKEYIASMFSQTKPPEVTVVELPSKQLYGIRRRFYSCFSETPNGPEVTPLFWKELVTAVAGHPEVSPQSYWGLISKASDAEEDDGVFDYLASFETAALPATVQAQLANDFVTADFPGGLYALFEQVNPPKGVIPNLNYLFCIWLGKTGYVLDDRTEVEIYGPEYTLEDPRGSFKYGIPLKK
ncbi:MAG: AraC family transcriptional regulator [Oligoflexia bacterium]|nr:AraC family transcriptional regulator [Oligoflexia bacterium]